MLEAIPLILVVLTLSFFLIHLAPGDPVHILVGEAYYEPEYIDRIKKEFGLDRPLLEQFIVYMSNAIRGNLGYSIYYRTSVLNIILERIPATLLLMFTALAFSALVGIVLGVASAQRPYSLLDSLCTSFAAMGYSIPTFWLAMLIILAFSYHLNLFPSHGMTSFTGGLPKIIDVLYHLVLPALTLGIIRLALITRLTRASMLDVLKEDYITFARSKGVKERTVIYDHGLKNAILPIITVFGMYIGAMFGGAVLTETVFAWPGLGRLVYQSISARDYPVVMGIFIVVSIMVIITNLITDVIYALVDPRIRYK